MNRSVKEIAKLFGVTKIEAYGFVKFLEKQGLAKVESKRRTSAGRGRSENVYSISENAAQIVGKRLNLLSSDSVALVPFAAANDEDVEEIDGNAASSLEEHILAEYEAKQIAAANDDDGEEDSGMRVLSVEVVS